MDDSDVSGVAQSLGRQMSPATKAEHPQHNVPASATRLLYVVSEDWYFLSHRLPMARAARDSGYEVHVATRVVDGAKAIDLT